MTSKPSREILARASFLAVLILSAPSILSSPSLPPGIADFAGNASHNFWYLFGETNRSELDRLNRELRQVQQQLQRPNASQESRQEALGRGTTAAADLFHQIKACPSIHLNLAASPPRFEPATAIELPGDSGALLFEINGTGDGVGYATTMFDLALPPGESSLITLDLPANGTCYALVGLEHVPLARTTLGLELRRPNDPPVRLPLDITTPSPGRLKLTVLSDDTGKPVPAMVELTWAIDGLTRQPANGIEFGLQFDKQGKASGARNPNLPRPLNETFWCVPGPVDMALPPGRWRIGVRRGVEHEVLFRDLFIHSGETLEQIVRPRRWVDMRKRGWWSGDDHVHCRILSDQDARYLMAWAQAEDVHLANIVKMGDIYRTYFEQRGFGPDYRVVDGQYVLSPGQECPRTHDQIGHTLAMNTTSMVRDTDRYFLYDEVFDAVHAQGGLSGYAHVNSGSFHVHRDMSMNVPRQKVDFAEILQFNRLGTTLYYDFLNLGCKLTASAGSDVPWGGTIGEARAYVYLGKKSFSADAWFDAFRRGRTFTTTGPMLELRVDDALPGDEVRLHSRRVLRVRARAWGDPKRMSPMKLEVVRFGEVIGSAESPETSAPEVQLDFPVNVEFGCWIAARARAGNGTSAHTTPVYIVRDGFRFWKFDDLPELISKRLNSLAELEKIIAEARELDASGKLETDRYRKQLANEGSELLEKVARARTLYADLEHIAQLEKTGRASSR